MELGAWLRDLGLERYEAAFRDQAIDMDILPELTESDLAQLGVVLGDRKRLRKAIADLSLRAVIRLATPGPRAARDAAERRPVAVMFCDLVGSTNLSARLDAEDWRDLLGEYIDEAVKQITHFGGHVLKILGDGVMALFGYPTAQENDAERAARAGLAIHRALDEINVRNVARGLPALVARVGIDLGPVVVDSTGEVFGDPPNVAARVQTAAEPGQLLVTAAVQRQIAGLFVAEDKGPHDLKGVQERMTLFRVVRLSGGGRRSVQKELTPLVNREQEKAVLRARWQSARAGEGQVLLFTGEPGIGKSRIVDEFHSWLRDTPHTWIEWRSSQLLQNTPLHPMIEWARQRFGGEDVGADKRLHELEAALENVGLDPEEYAPLLAPIIDLPLPSARELKLPPEELRRRQMAAIAEWILAGAKTQPIVLVIEDLHWTDPTTLEVLSRIAERAAEAPLFVIATARPEFLPAWDSRPDFAAMNIGPLDRAQILTMVGEISARIGLSREAADHLTERTGGVPLFVEELTRLLVERGGLGDDHALPPTLQQSLAARLDRLGPAREAAMIGSVLGREFSFALLCAVAGTDEAELGRALEKLAEAGILIVDGRAPDANCRFRHALIQDSAYETLLKSRRQTLHRRAAEILRDRLAARATAEPEAIAHHFTLAGLADEAIEWWGKAGDQALRRSAFREAIAHLSKAIELADREAATPTALSPQWQDRRVRLQSEYGTAVAWLRGFGADETKAAFARARELAEAAGQIEQRATSYYGVWVGHLVRAELAAARERAEALVAEMQTGGPSALLATAHRLLAMTAWLQGDYGPSRAHSEAAIAMSSLERDLEGRRVFGQDNSVVAPCYLAYVLWLTGHVRPALELVARYLNMVDASNHLPTQVNAIDHAAILAVARGDHVAARPLAARMAELSAGPGLTLYSTSAEMILTWCDGRERGASGVIERMRAAIAAYAAPGSGILLPLYNALLAEFEADGPDPDRALSTFEEALKYARVSGEHWTTPLLHRIRGDILLKLGQPALAEQAYIAGIDIARAQGARCFGLQAAVRLATLYGAPRAREASDRLAAALEGFPAATEWKEIDDARALLEALARSG
ncbi:MAG: AAA family ATPase [Pseudomonadota bacterium]|nr:AAA family ATPase [Pseudomonadota bacterium]